jgi:hypothetical protein
MRCSSREYGCVEPGSLSILGFFSMRLSKSSRTRFLRDMGLDRQETQVEQEQSEAGIRIEVHF